MSSVITSKLVKNNHITVQIEVLNNLPGFSAERVNAWNLAREASFNGGPEFSLQSIYAQMPVHFQKYVTKEAEYD